MPEAGLTRRRFTLLATAAAALPATVVTAGRAFAAGRPTAGEVIGRITARSGVALPDKSVDGLKAGDAQTAVQGVAVTAMATMDVLQQAAKAGLNLVVSLEPTFYGRGDAQPGPPPQFGGPPVAADDPILAAKRAFLAAHGMVVYRFHDGWIERKQGDHARALAAAMGWTRATADGVFEIAPARLSALVPQIRAKLKSGGGLRAVGDPGTTVRRVRVLPGLQSLAQLVAALPSADLLLVGESRDWEGPEYVGDASTAGLNKGMVMIGRVLSGDPGMRACADWVRSFVPEAPVKWIAAGEPFWRSA